MFQLFLTSVKICRHDYAAAAGALLVCMYVRTSNYLQSLSSNIQADLITI